MIAVRNIWAALILKNHLVIISNTNSDSSSRDKASSDIKHIKSTRDSDTHKHDSTRKKLNGSGDNLEGILKGIL